MTSRDPIRIKICGLRREEDVDTCVRLGVDALGFNFWPRSTRHISPREAASLVDRLPAGILPVGVFVGASPGEVASAVAASHVRAIQLHGDEDPAQYAHIPVERIQVLRVRPNRPLPETASSAADWILIDAWVEGFGGAGARFDWGRAVDAKTRYGRPVMIAGGITDANVSELLLRARPQGVDVASGVEERPGIKDPAKVEALVRAVRAHEESVR